MSGDFGVSFSAMEADSKIEITCKDGKLSITAEQAVKLNIKTTLDIKAGQDVSFEGKSSTTMTSSSDSNMDTKKMDIA
jgi:hypothetical protein